MSDISSFEQLKKDVASAKAAFREIPQDMQDIAWVQAKLSHMCDIDQHMRNFMVAFYTAGGPENAQQGRELYAFGSGLDRENAQDLKDILKAHGWVNISTFGAEADYHAFMIVQHADHDRGFQKEVLQKLENLHAVNETSPRHYPYLFDRVAAAEGLQRYGTQGVHDAHGQWEPLPCEDPQRLDERRKAIGLEPLAQYRQRCSVTPKSAPGKASAQR